MDTYIEATFEAGKKFYLDFNQKGKIVMLNLLKFNNIANYKNLDTIKPNKDISGSEAYALYMDHTLPLLKKAGSRILFHGSSSHFLIGPEHEKWDAILLVEHESVTKFMEFAKDKVYLKNIGHRTAALKDSRLLPISQL